MALEQKLALVLVVELLLGSTSVVLTELLLVVELELGLELDVELEMLGPLLELVL